jgi:hypothetical protein
VSAIASHTGTVCTLLPEACVCVRDPVSPFPFFAILALRQALFFARRAVSTLGHVEAKASRSEKKAGYTNTGAKGMAAGREGQKAVR